MSFSESWTDPIPILQGVIPLISTSADLDHVRATDQAMRDREEERAREFDQVQGELRALARKLKASQQQAVRKPSHPSEQQHRATVQQLDTSKFALGKTINERQTAAAKAEHELERLKEECEELSRERDEWLKEGGTDDELDQEALRLKLNHALGYTLVRPLPATTSTNDDVAPAATAARVLVRNDARPDVRSVPLPSIDAGEDIQRRMALVDQLWALAAEE